jgi:hypothetical protein
MCVVSKTQAPNDIFVQCEDGLCKAAVTNAEPEVTNTRQSK